jgi:hypothetical protein
MESRCCCASSCAVGVPRARRSRRIVNVAQWGVPGVILVLMPKCPACVAAYVALVTGVGLSMTAATYVRATAILLCVAMLAYVAGRHASLLLGRRFSLKGAAR